MVYNTLNKLKWKGGLEKCKIIIRHRGAPQDEKTIQGRDIVQVKKSHIICRVDDKETFIPLHRILRVTLEGKVLWKRDSGK